MSKIKQLILKFNHGLLFIGAVFGSVGVLLTTVNAICRKFANFTFPWAEELCTYMIVMAVFLIIPYLELSDGHLSVGIIESVIPNKVFNKILFIFKGILILVIFVLIVRYGYAATVNAHISNTMTYVLKWPRSIFFGVAVVSFVLSIISWLSIFILNKGDKIV